MRLTSKTYIEEGLLLVADAVLKLPSLNYKNPQTHKSYSGQVKTCPLLARNQGRIAYFELSGNQQDGQQKVGLIKTSQKMTNRARYRVRTCDLPRVKRTLYR